MFQFRRCYWFRSTWYAMRQKRVTVARERRMNNVNIQCVTSHKKSYLFLHPRALLFEKTRRCDPRLRSVVAPTTQGTFQLLWSTPSSHATSRLAKRYPSSARATPDMTFLTVGCCLAENATRSNRREENAPRFDVARMRGTDGAKFRIERRSIFAHTKVQKRYK